MTAMLVLRLSVFPAPAPSLRPSLSLPVSAHVSTARYISNTIRNLPPFAELRVFFVCTHILLHAFCYMQARMLTLPTSTNNAREHADHVRWQLGSSKRRHLFSPETALTSATIWKV